MDSSRFIWKAEGEEDSKNQFESLAVVDEPLNKGVVLNIQQANNELKKYTNPLEPYIKKMYDYFLKANKQTAGIKSYSLVVNLLVNEYSNQ